MLLRGAAPDRLARLPLLECTNHKHAISGWKGTKSVGSALYTRLTPPCPRSAATEAPCVAVVGASGVVFGLAGATIADMVLNFESLGRPVRRVHAAAAAVNYL